MKKKKAIIFDVDGTIMPQGGVFDFMPSDRLKKVVAKLKDSYFISFASGRQLEAAKHLAEFLQLENECIISGGTEMFDPKTGEIVWRIPLPNSAKEHLAKVLGDVKNPFYTNDYDHDGMKVEDVLEGMALGLVTVIYVTGLKPNDASKLEKQLQHPDLTIINMHHYLSYELRDIHIHSKKASKEHAVNKLMRQNGIEKQDVIVIGDGGNDLHLFKAGGFKVAMGNSASELKAVADIVIGDVSSDGLAEYLESLAK